MSCLADINKAQRENYNVLIQVLKSARMGGVQAFFSTVNKVNGSSWIYLEIKVEVTTMHNKSVILKRKEKVT